MNGKWTTTMATAHIEARDARDRARDLWLHATYVMLMHVDRVNEETATDQDWLSYTDASSRLEMARQHYIDCAMVVAVTAPAPIRANRHPVTRHFVEVIAQ